MFDRTVLLLLALLWGSATAQASPGWRSHVDPTLGYRVELPLDSFAPTAESTADHLQLAETDGDALIDVYGGEDPKRLAPSVFADQLAKADRIADVTYRKTGKTWFVISGHYRRDDNESGSLI